eukprot:scaffold20361_cov46-Cyclotella_meneghiniana.AAC.1
MPVQCLLTQSDMPGQCLLPQLSIVKVEVRRLHPLKRQQMGVNVNNEKAKLNLRELSLSRVCPLSSCSLSLFPHTNSPTLSRQRENMACLFTAPAVSSYYQTHQARAVSPPDDFTL